MCRRFLEHAESGDFDGAFLHDRPGIMFMQRGSVEVCVGRLVRMLVVGLEVYDLQ